MNRTVVFGIAVFFAVLGLTVIGSDNKVSAGLLRCAGKCIGVNCGGNDHCGGRVCAGRPKRCHGGLLARLRDRRCNKCHVDPCCGPAPTPCCEPAPAPAPCCKPAPAPCCEAKPCCDPKPCTNPTILLRSCECTIRHPDGP